MTPEGRDKLQRLSNIVSNSDPDRLSGRARSWLSYGLTEGPNFGSKVHTPPRTVACENQRRLRADEDICMGRGRTKAQPDLGFLSYRRRPSCVAVWAARKPAGWPGPRPPPTHGAIHMDSGFPQRGKKKRTRAPPPARTPTGRGELTSYVLHGTPDSKHATATLAPQLPCNFARGSGTGTKRACPL